MLEAGLIQHVESGLVLFNKSQNLFRFFDDFNPTIPEPVECDSWYLMQLKHKKHAVFEGELLEAAIEDISDFA